ncbi:hypothetical protein [Luedemannella helvata]|uniref:hypothetical protein n=1 Tax=Luedemannella helvata TaxID=349315 RepID=UPI0031D4696D
MAEAEWAQLRAPVWLTRTGGFVGARDRIMISRFGAWTHQDLRTGQTRTGHLDRWEVLRLNRLLDLARGTRPRPGPPNCADAFRFTLVTSGIRAGYEECGQRVGPVGDVVHFILRAVST